MNRQCGCDLDHPAIQGHLSVIPLHFPLRSAVPARHCLGQSALPMFRSRLHLTPSQLVKYTPPTFCQTHSSKTPAGMDSIEGTPENKERAVGEAMTARAIELDQYQGLGPPDLCSLTKNYVRAWLPYEAGSLPGLGYYHWIVGADCSCPAAVSTYIDALNRAQRRAVGPF